MSTRATTHATGRGKPRVKMPPSAQAARRDKVPVGTTGDARDKVAANAAPGRWQLIAEAAYYIAERRGFAPGSELDDWLRAEAEIEAQEDTARQ